VALLHVHFFAETLGMERQMDVILPEKTTRQDGKVPVLYLLHGGLDDHTVWQRRTGIERYADERGLAVVMPGADLSFYCDMKYGYDYYRFFRDELPLRVHEFFPTISTERSKTYIAGISMGGFGALKLAINCPEKFSHAASFSGLVDPVDGITTLQKAVESGQAESALLDTIYRAMGTAEEVEGTINDLPQRLESKIRQRVKLPKFYIACGTEDFMYPMNAAFAERFQGRCPMKWVEAPGSHEWGFWNEQLKLMLRWIEEVG